MNNPSPVESFLASGFHCIPGEDPAEFDTLVRDYRRQFDPQGPCERFYLETMILCDWKKRRLARSETKLLNCIPPFENGDVTPVLKTVARQIHTNDLTYFRAYSQLRKLQQERQQPAPAPTKPQAPAKAKPEPATAAPPPSPQTGGTGIGFVSQKHEQPRPSTPARIPHYDLGKGNYRPGLVFVG